MIPSGDEQEEVAKENSENSENNAPHERQEHELRTREADGCLCERVPLDKTEKTAKPAIEIRALPSFRWGAVAENCVVCTCGVCAAYAPRGISRNLLQQLIDLPPGFSTMSTTSISLHLGSMLHKMAALCYDSQVVLRFVVLIQPSKRRGPRSIFDGGPLMPYLDAAILRNANRVEQHQQKAQPEMCRVECTRARVVEVGHDVREVFAVYISADDEAVEYGEDAGTDRRIWGRDKHNGKLSLQCDPNLALKRMALSSQTRKIRMNDQPILLCYACATVTACFIIAAIFWLFDVADSVVFSSSVLVCNCFTYGQRFEVLAGVHCHRRSTVEDFDRHLNLIGGCTLQSADSDRHLNST